MQSHQSRCERLLRVAVLSVWSWLLRVVSVDLIRFARIFVLFGRGVVDLEPFSRVIDTRTRI